MIKLLTGDQQFIISGMVEDQDNFGPHFERIVLLGTPLHVLL